MNCCGFCAANQTFVTCRKTASRSGMNGRTSPSQLYEALLEGLVLFIIIWVFSARQRPPMAVSGMFLVCYGVMRFCIEFVRVPDADFGYLAFGWVTMGQILTAPMILLGATLLFLAYRNGQAREAMA